MTSIVPTLLLALPFRHSRQRRGVRRQRCRGLPASATPLLKAFTCPNAQSALDSGVVGAKGLRLAPLPPHSTTLTREKGGEAILADPSLIARNYREAVKQYMHEIDDLIRTTAIDCHRVKPHEKYDDVLVKFLLARIQKKGGR